MGCENCRTSDCDGGASCPVEALWALNARRSPLFGPDGNRLPLVPLTLQHDLPPDKPARLRGWSWGGFLLSWVWAIWNGVWIGLLALIPFAGLPNAFMEILDDASFPDFESAPYLYIAAALWLGFKGRAMAWKSGKWKDQEEFERVQQKWTKAGIWIWVALGVLAVPLSLWWAFMSVALGSKTG